MNYIGRGECRVQRVLECLYHGKATILSQVHIQGVIKKEDYEILGKEHNQHKFDLVVKFNSDFEKRPDLVIEVNYKHKTGAGRKWHNVYAPAVVKAGKIPLTIDDHASQSLFDVPHSRPLRWMDYVDVINALDAARIPP